MTRCPEDGELKTWPRTQILYGHLESSFWLFFSINCSPFNTKWPQLCFSTVDYLEMMFGNYTIIFYSLMKIVR